MIKKCLFPAAGYGPRFLPATKSMPKEMMPVVNKPLIEYGVDEAIQAGMTDMRVVTGRGKNVLMDHFDKNYELEHQISGTNKENLLTGIRSLIDAANFTYIRQREMKGLGHAISPFTSSRGSKVCLLVSFLLPTAGDSLVATPPS